MKPGKQHSGARGPALPKPGDVLVIDGSGSVQFAGDNQMMFRVTKVDEQETYAGWVWLHGYSLAPGGEAKDKREIFVQIAGLKRVQTPPPRQIEGRSR
jgi:hypothetical protein